MRWPLRLAILVGLAAVLAFPAGATAQTVRISGLTLVSSNPTTSTNRMSDLAFWGNRAYVGTYSGFRIFDITNPAAPVRLVDFVCTAASGTATQGDVSVWQNRLLFRSLDTPQTTTGCNRTATAGAGVTQTPGWEGVEIFDVSNPAAPTQIAAVATDCGSHTHTLVPDLRNNRLLIYASSYPAAAISSTPTQYGNTCERLTASGAQGHDKISIIEVPLNAPQTARVIAEPQFGFQGNFQGVPGFKGCHDITVFIELRLAAGACLTEGVIFDISNPAAPRIKNRIVNPDIDFCARRAPDPSPTPGAPSPNPLCLWHSATFTWDGKFVVFGDEAGGGGSAECSSEDPPNRGAFWAHRVDNPTSPIASFKIPRVQPHPLQNCTAHIMNFVPINNRLVMPSSWYSGGTSVVDWGGFQTPREMAYFEVEPGALGAQDPAQTNTWTSYWYNDFIFTNDGGNPMPTSPTSTTNGGQRGFEVFTFDVPWRTQAWNFSRFNPQTQENLIRCGGHAEASALRAGRRGSIHSMLQVQGPQFAGPQPIAGAVVRLTGAGVNKTARTNAAGEVTMRFTPRRAGTIRSIVLDQPNMLGCSVSFRVRAAAGRRGTGPSLTGRVARARYS